MFVHPSGGPRKLIRNASNGAPGIDRLPRVDARDIDEAGLAILARTSLLLALERVEDVAAVTERLLRAPARRPAGELLICGIHQPMDSMRTEDEIRLALQLKASAVAVPVGSVATVEHLSSLLAVEEALQGLQVGDTAVIPVFGADPAAFFQASAILGELPRVAGTIFDGPGLVANGGIVESSEAYRTARGMLLLASSGLAGMPCYSVIDDRLTGDALANRIEAESAHGFTGVIYRSGAAA